MCGQLNVRVHVREGVAARSVTAEPVSCSLMSMTFFDRLVDNNVVRDSGHIVKCFDDFCDDFVISDELRKVRGQLIVRQKAFVPV